MARGLNVNCIATRKPGPCKEGGADEGPTESHEGAAQYFERQAKIHEKNGNPAKAAMFREKAKKERATKLNMFQRGLDKVGVYGRGFMKHSRPVANHRYDSEGICLNCGGKGGKPGPCPEAAEAGERAKTGPGGWKFLGRYWGGREFSNIAKKMSEDAVKVSARAEQGFKTADGGTNMSHASHAEAAVRHRDAAEAHRIAQADMEDAGKYVKARAHKDTARTHDEAADKHERDARSSLSRYLRTPGTVHKRKLDKEGKPTTTPTQRDGGMRAGGRGFHRDHFDDDHDMETAFHYRGRDRDRTYNQEGTMTRKEMIEYLVSNSPNWGDEGDRDVLNKFSDEKLTNLVGFEQEAVQAVAIANSAMEGFEDEKGNAFRLGEDGQWLRREPTNNNPPPFAKGKKQRVEDPSDEEDYEMGMDDEDDDDDTVVENRRRPSIEDLPPHIQDRLRMADELERKEKMEVINVLLADANPETRKRQEHRLLQRPLADLQADAEILANREGGERSLASNRNNGRSRLKVVNPDEDILTLPGVDATTERVDNSNLTESDIDEEINRLPPHLKALLSNARSLEAKEKRRYIDQIVSNCGSQEDEIRWRNMLASKSVDELKLMTRMPGLRGNRRTGTSYVGNNAPRGGGDRACDPHEDVLPPTPSILD